jgi:integrase
MAIFAECPGCHIKQATSNKKCKCGQNLDRAKKSKTVRYWIGYRMPDGKQRRESVGTFEGLNPYSITDARDAESKKVVQKKEKRLFDMLPESEIMFYDLADWYKDLKQVKKLKSFRRIKAILANFNGEFGQQLVNKIKTSDLTDYQEKRLEQKASPRTVDYEISVVKTMVRTAKYDKKVDYRVLEVFEPVKRKLKPGSNVRKRVLGFAEYLKLIAKAPQHLRVILTAAFYTGMRMGELLKLKWKYIDRTAMFIRLPAKVTKEERDKDIPINQHVKKILDSVPRALNHDYVFTYRGQSFEEGGIKKSFMTACKNAGIPHGRKTENGITFHDLRRTAKTNMLKAGIEKEYRDTILGHSLKGMDVHYLVLDEKSLAEAMNKFTKWVDGQLESANVDHTVDQEYKIQNKSSAKP